MFYGLEKKLTRKFLIVLGIMFSPTVFAVSPLDTVYQRIIYNIVNRRDTKSLSTVYSQILAQVIDPRAQKCLRNLCTASSRDRHLGGRSESIIESAQIIEGVHVNLIIFSLRGELTEEERSTYEIKLFYYLLNLNQAWLAFDYYLTQTLGISKNFPIELDLPTRTWRNFFIRPTAQADWQDRLVRQFDHEYLRFKIHYRKVIENLGTLTEAQKAEFDDRVMISPVGSVVF